MFYIYYNVFQAIAVLEYAIEHAAENLGVDPLQLRLDNMVQEGESPDVIGPNPLLSMIDQLKTSADYDNRVANVETFNQVKKGFKHQKILV